MNPNSYVVIEVEVVAVYGVVDTNGVATTDGVWV